MIAYCQPWRRSIIACWVTLAIWVGLPENGYTRSPVTIDIAAGEIRQTSSLLRVVGTWRNDRDVELIIKEVRTSCNCTKAAVKQRVLPPGVSLEIDFEINLEGRNGRFEMSAAVEFVSDETILHFRATGNVNRVATCSPRALNFLPGSANILRKLKVFVTPGENQWQLLNISQSVNWAKCRATGIARSQGGNATVLDYEIEILPNWVPEDRREGTIIFQLGCLDGTIAPIELRVPIQR